MPRFKEQERSQVRSETRRRLLEAAVQEFAREGYHQAKIDEISKMAGFAKGTVYNYFQSKHALMLALIEEIAQFHLAYISSRVLAESDAVQRLEKFFEAGFGFVYEHLNQALVMVNNLYGPNVEFKSVMFQAYQPMFDLVDKDILLYGSTQGVFREVDSTLTAGLVMNIYLGTASQVNGDGKSWIQAEQVLSFILAALRRLS